VRHELVGHAPTLYAIESSDSTTNFTVDEVLRGSPKTLVGTTDHGSGQLAFDVSDRSSAQIGIILIDTRTLATDDSSRNPALREPDLEYGCVRVHLVHADRADQRAMQALQQIGATNAAGEMLAQLAESLTRREEK
jgi:hypothetical protein